MDPRILRIVLRGEEATVVAPAAPAAVAPLPAGVLASVAAWGGPAAGLVALLEASAGGREAPFVVAVGEAVRRGLPTAARATVMSRAPLTGRLGLGQVGGALGVHLAAVADALVLEGSTSLPGAVLFVEPDGSCTLRSLPELVGLAPVAASRVLAARAGAAAWLVVGPAGERGAAFANLASEGASPSFVGRGGLGAAFARTGLKALVVRGQPRPAATVAGGARSRALYAALTRSPRLAARAAGGTFELYHAHAARGELVLGEDAPLTVLEAERLQGEARERVADRKGCRGCPTPCGWVFERSRGERQQAHFGAAEAIGTRLGLGSLDDALALLSVCDELGVDAKEAGAVLAVLERARREGKLAGAPAFGARAALESDLRSLLRPANGHLRAGAAEAARALGVPAVDTVRSEAAGIERGLAGLLARHVSTGGADPMRTFPFLLETGGRALVERLVGARLGDDALDPRSPAAKGLLVWWHENLVAAIDLTGFCAFSSAGLLADGCATLDELAGWILPERLARPADDAWRAAGPGARLLAAGASIVLLRHLLDARYAREAGRSEPSGALREAVREYHECRGLCGAGAPSARALAAFATPALAAPLGDPALAAPAAGDEGVGDKGVDDGVEPDSIGTGTIELRAGGALARALEGRSTFRIRLPCSVREALRQVAAVRAELAPHLLLGDDPLPAVWRDGRRLQPADRLEAGDVLELVTAIAGG